MRLLTLSGFATGELLRKIQLLKRRYFIFKFSVCPTQFIFNQTLFTPNILTQIWNDTIQLTFTGIIPRLCSQLFKLIPSSEDGQKVRYVMHVPLSVNSQFHSVIVQANVEVSYMEIYNEKVFDLLDLGNATKKSGLKVR